uniref:Dirigent protein n=2 Tax=Oryza sativa subsp. japonica TaxID=39947 RepID=Q10K21_ORYSJ|nr:hypothetical protein Os03g28180 [Oryza sativa Japonica Group]ABF96454.1 hypothetical protein LOC_Os03g28180 [Oryza sativa Japonica Group]
MLTLAFSLGLSDDGDYKGSTLVLDGRVDFGGGGAAERAVVGGTGRFRRARGYSLMTKFGNPTPSTGVFEMDTGENECQLEVNTRFAHCTSGARRGKSLITSVGSGRYVNQIMHTAAYLFNKESWNGRYCRIVKGNAHRPKLKLYHPKPIVILSRVLKNHFYGKSK